MKTQKSNNTENTAKVLAFQLPMTKDAARTTPSNSENNEKASSMGPRPARKKDVKSRQFQPVLTLVHSEEEFQTQIAKRAYELYEQRGWQHGNDQADWFQAENEVSTQRALG